MKIWILNNYNTLPKYGALNRAYFFGKQLKQVGHEPVVFVGSHPHNTDLQLIEGNEKFKISDECEFPWVLIKTCAYKNSRVKRVVSMFEYYVNLMKSAEEFEAPDVIIGSSAHPLAAVAAIKLSKRYGCKCIAEIRDLWPESIVAYGLAAKKNLLIKLLYRLEKWIYRKAHGIIFTMEGGKDYIIDKGWDEAHGGPVDLSKVHHINNGVDLEEFEYNKKHYTIDCPDLNNPDIFKVVYAGSIRLANKIHKLVDVASILSEKGIGNIKILIWGAGNQVDYINRMILEKGLKNIVYKGKVPKVYIPDILSKSNLNVYILEDSSLLKYGLSINKSFEYFASGKPVLANRNSAYSVIDKYKCGVCLDTFTPEAMADEIIKFSRMPKDEYNQYCENARKAAQAYDFKVLTEKLLKVIEKVQAKETCE